MDERISGFSVTCITVPEPCLAYSVLFAVPTSDHKTPRVSHERFLWPSSAPSALPRLGNDLRCAVYSQQERRLLTVDGARCTILAG